MNKTNRLAVMAALLVAVCVSLIPEQIRNVPADYWTLAEARADTQGFTGNRVR